MRRFSAVTGWQQMDGPLSQPYAFVAAVIIGLVLAVALMGVAATISHADGLKHFDGPVRAWNLSLVLPFAKLSRRCAAHTLSWRESGMTYPRSLLKATVVALPLGTVALGAHAADVMDTIKEQPQFSTLAKAIEAAGMAEALQGEGPFTVFAPTDEAFSQLPQGATDELMKEGNQAALEALIAQHVVEGKEIMAKDVLGKQQELTTLQGDTLTIDGINPTVLLVPTGLTITRIDDRVIVQREGVAVPATSLEVESQMVRSAGGGSQQTGQEAQAAQTGEQQTAVSEQGDMPMSPHQQQALATDPEQQPTQTGGTAMPSTKHQRQVLAESEIEGEQKQYYQLERVKGLPDALREATLVTADIQADNGVIHAIDRVLVPEATLSKLESMPSQ